MMIFDKKGFGHEIAMWSFDDSNAYTQSALPILKITKELR